MHDYPIKDEKKLDDRAVKCIFVGYANQTTGYRLWCSQKRDVMTKHIKFAEDKIGYEWIYSRAAQGFRHEV